MSAFLVVTDSASIAEEAQELLEELLGPVVIEVAHEDGRLVLSRLQRQSYDLAFLPLGIRRLEVLTLLRALGPDEASRVLLLVPDTLEGFRTAWEGMRLGARDLVPTKGSPPQRLKGHHDLRLRQLAWHLAVPGVLEPPRLPEPELLGEEGPLVLVPETRHLVSAAEWVLGLPRHRAVVVRVPEGARLARVYGEELSRWIPWPTRILRDGDLLTPGHVHFFTEPETIRLQADAGRQRVRLTSQSGAPGSWCARRELLAGLAGSTAPFVLLTGDPLEPEEEAVLGAGRPGRIVLWMEDSTGRSTEHAA